MKCIIKRENNKKDNNGLIVRRKFVPIKFTIQRENQFLNAGAKLPFTAAKVNALLVTSKVEKKCSDSPITPRYYFGITDSKMEDERFLELNDGIEYNDSYPPDIYVEQQTEGWWYFAHPATDKLPFYQGDGFLEPLEDYKELNLQFDGQCNPNLFFLWSGIHTGTTFITFEEYT
ncbi:hypothetical protein [uncultured Aquimarina sp.]|uniref:hypothetical protein n=1 Tax=uncultured Aquimarina sp. TaxID=575652 RepID=UPI00261742D1|nr:hypothetical protein [uncultured Aquimarina sp.]